MKCLCTLLILALLLATMPGEASGKSVRAFFNGQEATVSGVVLRPAEPFTVDLYITPGEESYAFAEVDEPGVTRAYDLLSGDEIIPTYGKRCNASSTAHYRWVMAANDNWLDGTAPLNIYYQINAIGCADPSDSGLFTVMEAYIAPGDTVTDESKVDSPDSPENVPSQGLIMSAFSIIMAAVVVAQKRK